MNKNFFIILEEYTVSNILGTHRITCITGDYNKHICVHECVCREIEKERQRGVDKHEDNLHILVNLD